MLRRLLPLTVLCVVALAACQPATAIPPTEAPGPAAGNAPQLTVETAEVVIGVGSPIPVDIAITGRLPNTCTQIGSMEQRLDGFNIRIAVNAFTPPLNDCMDDSVPFRTAMPLNTIGLPDGTYTIIVNDSVSTTFTMPVQAGAATPDLRQVPVSNVTVQIGVGSPIPVDAFVSGEWPDLCAQLAEIHQRIEGNTIEITLLASAADPACPPDNVGLPFRIAIPVNVVQLPKDTYTVIVNGASATFDVPVTPPGAPMTSDGLTHYQGPNPYRSSPSFDVGYDPSVWEYVEDDGSGRQSQLMHRSLSGCSLWLRAGPVGAPDVSSASLAGYDWTISQAQPNVLIYSTPQGDIAFIFGLILPDAYSESAKSPCQEAAESVIETFKEVRQ